MFLAGNAVSVCTVLNKYCIKNHLCNSIHFECDTGVLV